MFCRQGMSMNEDEQFEAIKQALAQPMSLEMMSLLAMSRHEMLHPCGHMFVSLYLSFSSSTSAHCHLFPGQRGRCNHAFANILRQPLCSSCHWKQTVRSWQVILTFTKQNFSRLKSLAQNLHRRVEPQHVELGTTLIWFREKNGDKTHWIIGSIHLLLSYVSDSFLQRYDRFPSTDEKSSKSTGPKTEMEFELLADIRIIPLGGTLLVSFLPESAFSRHHLEWFVVNFVAHQHCSGFLGFLTQNYKTRGNCQSSKCLFTWTGDDRAFLACCTSEYTAFQWTRVLMEGVIGRCLNTQTDLKRSNMIMICWCTSLNSSNLITWHISRQHLTFLTRKCIWISNHLLFWFPLKRDGGFWKEFVSSEVRFRSGLHVPLGRFFQCLAPHPRRARAHRNTGAALLQPSQGAKRIAFWS